MRVRSISKMFLMLFLLVLTTSISSAQENIQIVFPEYNVTILKINKLGDTLYYNKGAREDFKFVFFDHLGKCYCERYIDKRLIEKGTYENSIDTLKKYVSVRFSNDKNSRITVRKYFQPLKNGDWIVFKQGRKNVQKYEYGILIE